ncbi:hypothetical protein [Roseovarius atlanticus]|uniref:hypothetical protein n=1 Tax=Roseovarius atlanticus TaxID=1641875 RepID=UPI0021BD0EBD|nr:hypothetical protein [Roseovarius atlanticus]
MTLTQDDLRAATAAGIIDEAQAARLSALSHERAGRIARRANEDEPFELFSGFAEIFISLGLILLTSGAVTFAFAAGGVVFVMAALMAVGWFAAHYFTLKRRMSLPSIVLVCTYATGAGGLIGFLLDMIGVGSATLGAILLGLGGMASILLHYRRFRVPFSMLLVGLYGFMVIYAITTETSPVDTLITGSVRGLFDLRQGGSLAIGTLIFGILAFIAGLWFDMQDPHRIGRRARSAFWLHLLAAPALVNTVMMTAYNIPGELGVVLTLIGLVIITAFALIIDRRSFLTAGLGYLAALIFWLLGEGSMDITIPILMLLLGSLITGLGTFWTHLRVALMRTLPNFPGKTRLPPYDDVTATSE